MRKRLILFVLLLALNNLLSQDKSITYYETVFPDYLDPVYGGKFMVGCRTSSLLFRTLYGYNKIKEFIPFMANGFPQPMDNSNLEFSLSLKPNMTWHDGRPITSRDIVRSYQILENDNTQYNGKELLEKFQSISMDGELGLIIKLKHSYDKPQHFLIFPILPAHILKSPFLSESNKFTNKPVGNGPFTLSNRGINEIVFSKFDDFINITDNNTHTNIEKVILEEKRDESLWAQDLMAGRVDLLIQVPLQQIAQLDNHQLVTYKAYPNFAVEMLGFNMRNNSSLLNLKFIRLAIAHAIRRKGVIEGFLASRADIVTGPYPFGSYYYWNMISPYEFSTTQAKEILESNGCVKGGDGIYRYNGKKLSFKTLFVQNNQRSQWLNTFTEKLQEAGIEILPDPQELNIYLSKLEQVGFDIAWVTPNYNEDFDISPLFHSQGVQNYWGYENTTIDDYFQKMNSTTDPQLKLQYGHQIHLIIHNDLPCFFLWTPHKYAGFIRRLKTFYPHPLDFFQTINEWELKE